MTYNQDQLAAFVGCTPGSIKDWRDKGLLVLTPEVPGARRPRWSQEQAEKIKRWYADRQEALEILRRKCE